MSRIQLSQPSFTNGYARSRGESVCPDLWPSHAWVPAFGPTGAALFDLCAFNNGTITNGIWNAGSISFAGTGGIDCGDVGNPTAITIIARGSTPAVGMALCGKWNTTEAKRSFAIYRDASAIRCATTETGVFNTSYDASSTSYPTRITSFALTGGDGFYTKHYQDGVLKATSSGAPSTMYDSTQSFKIARFSSDNYYYTGTIESVLMYYRVLSSTELLSLANDPLLPFRRRMPVFYSVPSAVGGTDNLTATGITTGAPVLGTPAIGQAHTLTVSAVTTGAPVLGTPAVGQAHALSATGITTSAPSLDTPSIGQAHVLAVVAITAGSPSVGAPTIGQVNALSADGIATGAPTLGTPELSSAAHSLTPDSITTGAPDLGEPAVGQTHALTAGSITTGAPFIAAPAIGQVHALSTVSITTEAPALGTPAIGLAAHDLAATAITTGAPTLGTPVIGQVHILTASGITARAPTLGTPSLDWAITDTPACRTTIIPYEDRTTTIPYENRTTIIS